MLLKNCKILFGSCLPPLFLSFFFNLFNFVTKLISDELINEIVNPTKIKDTNLRLFQKTRSVGILF